MTRPLELDSEIIMLETELAHYKALCEELIEALLPLSAIAFTSSELEQENKYGPRVLFEKGARITVGHILAARAALKKAQKDI